MSGTETKMQTALRRVNTFYQTATGHQFYFFDCLDKRYSWTLGALIVILVILLVILACL
jgi:hypothetical protein